MENNYIEKIAHKKALLLCAELGMFKGKYFSDTDPETMLPDDKIHYNHMLKNIQRDKFLLSCSKDSIKKHIESLQQTFGVSYEQAQQLCWEQTSFLRVSQDIIKQRYDAIVQVFGKSPSDFDSLVAFGRVMFQEQQNLEETVQAFSRVGITKNYCFNHPHILTATPYSIEAKYMFGVVNGLEKFNLPYRQDLIRQNFNKTVARYEYLQNANRALRRVGADEIPVDVIFDKSDEFIERVNSILLEHKDSLDFVEMYFREEPLLTKYKPDIKYLKKLESDYQEISSTTFEGEQLKYPLVVISKDYEQKVLQGTRQQPTQEDVDKRAEELQEIFGVSIEKARSMIKQNRNLLIYSTQTLQDKISTASGYFECTPEQMALTYAKRPTLINYEVETLAEKCGVYSEVLGMSVEDFRPVFLQNFEIATEDTDKFISKIEDLRDLGFTSEQITDNLKEVIRLNYGIKEKYMIAQIASNHMYQNPRVQGQYQDFTKYFFGDPNVDKIGRSSLAITWAKFKFIYDGINSEETDKLVVPQAFNTYFVNTKDLIKQYAATIGSQIPGFEVDKNRCLVNDLPQLGLQAGASFDELYPVLQAELIKMYPFDESSYELLVREYNKLDNVPPIGVEGYEEDEEQELPDCLITEEDKKTTIAQAKKSAENIIKGDKELNE